MTMDAMVVDVSQDWVLACEVQQGFMQAPSTASDSFDHDARCRQTRALGGDCYSFIPLKSDQMALVVGDASGKGLAAALMIANVQASLRTATLFSARYTCSTCPRTGSTQGMRIARKYSTSPTCSGSWEKAA